MFSDSNFFYKQAHRVLKLRGHDCVGFLDVKTLRASSFDFFFERVRMSVPSIDSRNPKTDYSSKSDALLPKNSLKES